MAEINPYYRPDRVPALSHVLLADGRRVAASVTPVPIRPVCKTVRKMTAELLGVTSDRIRFRRDRRRSECHVRQIAMYVCHVALRIPQADVAHGFGRDRTTVRHACSAVEDRRDDLVYDDFVAAVERLAIAVFEPAEGDFDAEE